MPSPKAMQAAVAAMGEGAAPNAAPPPVQSSAPAPETGGSSAAPAPAPETTPTDAPKATEPPKAVEQKSEPAPKVSDADRALLEKDKEIWQKQQALARAEKDLAEARRHADAFSLLQRDPIAFAEQHMPTDFYDRMTQRMLNQGKPSEDERYQALEASNKELREELHSLKTGIATKEQADKYERAASDYLANVRKALEGEGMRYGRAARNVDELARHFAVMHYQQTGQTLTPDETAAKVEQYVRDDYERMRNAFDATSSDAPPEPKPAPQSKTNGSEPKTLKNNIAGTPPAPESRMTRSGRIEAAVRALQSQRM